jgi:hydroxyethylthiazole kinase-like uncharacterized protein yjeF
MTGPIFLDTKGQGLTRKEINEREDLGVKMGISHLMMMENAGSSIARFVDAKFKQARRITIIAGTGNNGGDAFVAARHLSFWKRFKVAVVLIGEEKGIHAPEAKINYEILNHVSAIKKIDINSIRKLRFFERTIRGADVIISAIFGTGFHGKPRDLEASVIKIINSSKATKISVDVPSGMEADTGNYDIAVISDFTVTMDSPKLGMLASSKSTKACGKILVANIGVPA